MEQPIRVLQVIGIMNRGGAETLLMNLYRNIDREKVQFDFVENTLEKATFDDEIRSLGGRIYNCPHYSGKNHAGYKKWWKDFFAKHEGEYKIVHGHIGSTASIYLSEAKRNGLFTIAHSHNAGTGKGLRSVMYRAISYPTRFVADYFMACGEAAGEDRFGKRITCGADYSVLYNAIDSSAFRFDENIRCEVRTELGIEGRTVIGHIGRFEEQKNHRFLLDIFAEVLKKKPDAVLLLVGDGSLRGEIEEKAEKLGIRENVVFTGVRTDIGRLASAMDVFVFPSLYEGLGIVLVEAQCSGLPCVASDCIPRDGFIADGLVTVKSLDDTPQNWAEHIISRLGEERRDRRDEIIAAGYEISSVAKWLEDFYIEKHREN